MRNLFKHWLPGIFLGLVVAIGLSAYAGYNLHQKDDGGSVWVQSKDGSKPIEFTKEGDLWNITRVKWFDDFLGDALNAEYSVNSGGDAQAVDPAINAAENGTVRLTTGNAGTGVAADASAMTQELVWQADNGSLVMEAKVKLSAITDVIVNIGFTDVKTDGTLEIPFELNTTTLTSTASNAVAFLFDTGATNDNWHCAGVKADTDSGPTNSSIAPTAATYQTFRIEIDSSGNARCYIDGALVATLAAAVTATTSLTPIVIGVADSTTSRNIDVDYLFVAQDR